MHFYCGNDYLLLFFKRDRLNMVSGAKFQFFYVLTYYIIQEKENIYVQLIYLELS